MSFFLLLLFALPSLAQAASPSLLNVSYDPTREFYEQYNALFAAHWQEKTGEIVSVRQSHGGSAKQARSVMDGLPADVVTLALAYDIDAIAERTNLLPKTWQSRLPHQSCPFTSTIVLLVRKGNSKHIHDWDDLIRKDISVITPNPKISGGARWNHLAAFGYALKKHDGDRRKAQQFMRRLYANVPLLEASARSAAMTFVQRGLGDVLIAWENEAHLVQERFGKDTFEIILPSLSILAQPPVAVVSRNAKHQHLTAQATEYLRYLYSKPAQKLGLRYYYRPSDTTLPSPFPSMPLLTIDDFGGWKKAQREHFADGGLFDKIYGY